MFCWNRAPLRFSPMLRRIFNKFLGRDRAETPAAEAAPAGDPVGSLIGGGAYEQAAVQLAALRADALPPEQRWYYEARIAESRRRHQEAARLYGEILRNHPGDAHLLGRQAVAWQAAGALEQARLSFEAVADLAGHPDLLVQYGTLLWRVHEISASQGVSRRS